MGLMRVACVSQFRYSGCHAYDVSSLNVVLGQMFDFDEEKVGMKCQLLGRGEGARGFEARKTRNGVITMLLKEFPKSELMDMTMES